MAESRKPVVTLPLLGELRPARVSRPTRHSILRGIMVFRALSVVWAFGVFEYEIYDRNVRSGSKLAVAQPVAGSILFLGLLVFLGFLYRSYSRDADSILTPTWLFGEIGFATALFLCDVWVYGSPDHSQALPTVWPIAIIATIALTGGQKAAVATGFGFGVARYVGWLPYNETPWSLTRTSTLVLLMIAGWSAGYMFRRLEITDEEISGFRAREEVARTLHDGVLQTLAVIQRRSDDTELVALARRQEHELREYLFSGSQVGGDLASGLRSVARNAEELHGLTVNVVCAPDLPAGNNQTTSVLVGAVTEALNNVGKHADASEVTIYAEPDFVDDDVVYVSVKDNGQGFAVESANRGEGLNRSIVGRIADAGGRSDIRSQPGRGTEVQLWL